MTVIAIHIGPEEGGPLEAVPSVRARAGQGLEGDRYCHPSGALAGHALTLVEDEVSWRRASPGSTTTPCLERASVAADSDRHEHEQDSGHPGEALEDV
jgi:hypothetical protein